MQAAQGARDLVQVLENWAAKLGPTTVRVDIVSDRGGTTATVTPSRDGVAVATFEILPSGRYSVYIDEIALEGLEDLSQFSELLEAIEHGRITIVRWSLPNGNTVRSIGTVQLRSGPLSDERVAALRWVLSKLTSQRLSKIEIRFPSLV